MANHALPVADRYGRLAPLFPTLDRTGHRFWICLCDCGRYAYPTASSLASGKSRSCGCLRAERNAQGTLSHGMSNTREWLAWKEMRRRCLSPNRKCYANYGGRGITVCDRWAEFADFFADMGTCPPGGTLERDDVNGNYEPGNCRWIPKSEQALNTRRNLFVVIDGERMALSVACRRLGLRYGRVRDRISVLGWTPEQALSEPKKVNGVVYA